MFDLTPHVELAFTDSGSLDPAYFDQLYATDGDPWRFATSPYEAAKYEATLAALPRAKYKRALELGCSIGVLTRQLAFRCDHLLALDVSEAALQQARLRCADLSHVDFERRDISQRFPLDQQFNLIVLSEVGYYFAMPDLRLLRDHIVAALLPQAHLLLVHFTEPTNYPLTADAVHEVFLGEKKAWQLLRSERREHFRLDLLEVGDST